MSDDAYDSAINGRPADRWEMIIDRAGYCVSVRRIGHHDGELNFWTGMQLERERYPLAMADVVVPHLAWPFDEDGRGLTAMEHAQVAGLAALLRLNEFAHTLTTHNRMAA